MKTQLMDESRIAASKGTKACLFSTHSLCITSQRGTPAQRHNVHRSGQQCRRQASSETKVALVGLGEGNVGSSPMCCHHPVCTAKVCVALRAEQRYVSLFWWRDDKPARQREKFKSRSERSEYVKGCGGKHEDDSSPLLMSHKSA